jgi:addiction module HigA family antidote
MLAHMKTLHTDKTAEIVITIPVDEGVNVSKAIENFLFNAGHEVSWEAETEFEDGIAYTRDDLFPDRHPGMLITGFRLRDGLTQAELAEKLGIKQSRVSDMERRQRPISRKMAAKLSKVFNTSARIFIAV